ncbi:anti-sigma factor domain-containing protein [Cohnella sp. AR92]|uniref:anti-sigma factor domain-containing protein n=1 Tax=Cohnella sp. AR92 TaxID=648716 RepID=UPI000F8D4A16|nr:anti-sigma factor domain-containing protein [Cohnella sp. AR92]RUS45466.1 anti-sigma factor domain-containing protein [Cohnella sp. AR92]
MSKAIVMSIEGKRAVVLAPGGRFVRVPREQHYQVGDEIELESEEGRSLPRTASRRRTRWMAGAGTAALLCLLLFGGMWLHTPSVVAYVTMDVNPSVELGIDGKERVQKLRAVNPDAVPIIEGIDYKGKSLKKVTDQLVDKLASLHLLDGEDTEVVLTTVPVGKVDASWEGEVSSMMKQSIEEAGASSEEASSGTAEASAPVVTTVSVPKEVREEANAKGVSAGKMAFWLKAESQGHRVPLQKLQKESMNKISSSWGGVHEVLKDAEAKDKKQSDEEWKELVAKAKAKEDKIKKAKQQKKDEANRAGQPHASGSKHNPDSDDDKTATPAKSAPGASAGPASSKDSGKAKLEDGRKPIGSGHAQNNSHANNGNNGDSNKNANANKNGNASYDGNGRNNGNNSGNGQDSSSHGNRWGQEDGGKDDNGKNGKKDDKEKEDKESGREDREGGDRLNGRTSGDRDR